MDIQPLQVFLAVVAESSFSRAARKLGRSQPAVTLAIQKLEADLGETLIDRSSRTVRVTDAGRLVLDCARRYENLVHELENGIKELRDHSAGRLVIGANESTTLYLLPHIASYRHRYARIRVQIARSLSRNIPTQVMDGDLELGVISYAPDEKQFKSTVIYDDRLAFVVAPAHRLARRKSVPITELGMETFIAHNVGSPYRDKVLEAFASHQVPLNMDVELPTVEAIRHMVALNEGVAFLPRMCLERDLAQGTLVEVKVRELAHVERKIRLICERKRPLSHAAQAFLELVGESERGV